MIAIQTNPTQTFQAQFMSARHVSTPLLAVRTFDASSTIQSIRATVPTSTPMIQWDAAQGYKAITSTGKDELANILNGSEQAASAGLAEALLMAMNASEDTIIIVLNAHLFWAEPIHIQAIWNLRDVYKQRGNMLVLLCHSGAILPSEIASDVLMLDEPLPTLTQLESSVTSMYDAANTARREQELAELAYPDTDTMRRATDALIGLPSFPAEQAIAMSLDTSTGMFDLDGLWSRKREAINATPGLTVMTSSVTDTLDNIGGLDSIKDFLRAVMTGRDVPRLILFSDEIEKDYAGTGTETSGVKTGLTGQVLAFSADKQVDGVLCLGVPGAGKSQLAKCLGTAYGCPVINFNVSAMESSLVGSSAANLRAALATITAISDGRILWIGTCNSIHALPAELLGRFGLGKFFFDFPTSTERAAIWQVYRAQYQIDEANATPNSEEWTGREIKECCKKAYRLNIPLNQAAQYVVPVSVSSKDAMTALRNHANGRYLSASNPGMYRATESLDAIASHSSDVTVMAIPTSGRKMRYDS